MMRLICSDGLLGFEDIHDYELVEAEEPGPFMWLKAVDNDLGFILVEPGLFWENYRPEIPPDVLEAIGVNAIADTKLYIIVTVPSDPLLSTGNCFAPIVINEESGRMRQVLLRDSDYPLKAHLFPEHIRNRKAGVVGASPNSAQW